MSEAGGEGGPQGQRSGAMVLARVRGQEVGGCSQTPGGRDGSFPQCQRAVGGQTVLQSQSSGLGSCPQPAPLRRPPGPLSRAPGSAPSTVGTSLQSIQGRLALPPGPAAPVTLPVRRVGAKGP